jgi:hypothetical protein
MTVDELIEKLNTDPESIDFTEVINTIEKTCHYTPTRFYNGTGSNAVTNEAGTNEGSCKIFAFGKLHNLNEKQTLACFGNYYREDVLGHPENNDHRNIRNFMVYGWEGIDFEDEALTPMNFLQERRPKIL